MFKKLYIITKFIKYSIGIELTTKEFITNELENKILFEIKTNQSIDNRYIGLIYLKHKSLNHCSKIFLKPLKDKIK